jgi:hypothetical protein
MPLPLNIKAQQHKIAFNFGIAPNFRAARLYVPKPARPRHAV